MLLGIVAAAMALAWVLATWALGQVFDEVGRAVVLDDLGEYSALYARGGTDAVQALFTEGEHERDQMVRIVSPEGRVLLEVPLSAHPDVRWPDLPRLKAGAREETQWERVSGPGGVMLTIGRRSLSDGAELWFGRTDHSDRQAIRKVHQVIALAAGLTALLAVAPALWFASRVLRPVRKLIGDARRLVGEDAAIQRLESAAAIPELQEFAAAFNESLARVQRLAEELEAANDQLAHELRTPLARIRGNVETIVARPLDPEAKDGAVRALAEIDRATRLIHSILSIRAGDARTLKLQLEPVSPDALARETHELYAAAADEKGLGFHLELSGSGLTISADRERLQQALCNLLDNALAYTPRGGKVELQVAVSPAERSVSFVVRDNGPGLTAADAQQIWGRFSRGSAASANKPGIGLGLSLVRAIAHAHHGKAGGGNRPGGGAEFWIEMPIGEPAC